MTSRKKRPRSFHGPIKITYSQSRIKHHRQRNAVLVLTSIIILGLIVLGILSLPHPTVLAVGEQAPEFHLTDINGTSINLSQLRGHPVLIEFMSTSCVHCQSEAPVLSQLYRSFQGRVTFVSISITPLRDSPIVLQGFKERYQSPWTWARDTDTGDLALMYGVTATPTMYLLDRNGVVFATYVGENDGATMANTIVQLLQ